MRRVSNRSSLPSHLPSARAEKDWVFGDVRTSGVEGVWSLLKRSIIGAYHKITLTALAGNWNRPRPGNVHNYMWGFRGIFGHNM